MPSGLGVLARCRAASRAALPGARYEDRPESRETNGLRRERSDPRLVAAIAPRQDAGEPRARRATHSRGLGVLARCRAASRAALPGARYKDRPESRETNGLRRERSDPRLVAAIAPRQDAGEPRARRATHSRGLGVLARCRAASRAALPGARYEDRPESRETNGLRREMRVLRGVAAIAPRQDAGEPRARRATHRTRDPRNARPASRNYCPLVAWMKFATSLWNFSRDFIRRYTMCPASYVAYEMFFRYSAGRSRWFMV